MADIQELIISETDIYDSSNSEILNFENRLMDANSGFKEIAIIKDEDNRGDKIALILYHQGRKCFKFTDKRDSINFLPQKGLDMDRSIWDKLVNEPPNTLFHMFQYRPNYDITTYTKNSYYSDNHQVAIIITTDNTTVAQSNRKFKIELKDSTVFESSSPQENGESENEANSKLDNV